MASMKHRTLRNAAKAFRKMAWSVVGWAALVAVIAVPLSAAQQSATSQSAALGAEAPGAKPAPVFTKDVAPILQDKCQACHRPGYIAPMAFMTYEETRPWARS